MKMKLKPLSKQVMVITGASSGIGLTTARLASKRGVKLVLAARNEDALRELTKDIQQHGGQATFVTADVGNKDEVHQIHRGALESFGGYDTWVNNAGVGIYGRLLEVSTEDSRRLFDTNYWGLVYGSLAAARYFGEREGAFGGAIINIGSEVSDHAVPLLGMYSASKHAVKGFTDALRMELEEAELPVSVSLVKPAAIDTPFPNHAKTYLGEEPTLPPPIYAPEVVADVVLHCASTPVRELFAGGSAKMHSLQGQLAPRLVDRVMKSSLFKSQRSGQPPNFQDDALYGPTTALRQRGHAKGHVRRTSMYSEATMHPILTGSIVCGLALMGAGIVTSMSCCAQKR